MHISMLLHTHMALKLGVCIWEDIKFWDEPTCRRVWSDRASETAQMTHYQRPMKRSFIVYTEVVSVHSTMMFM